MAHVISIISFKGGVTQPTCYAGPSSRNRSGRLHTDRLAPNLGKNWPDGRGPNWSCTSIRSSDDGSRATLQTACTGEADRYNVFLKSNSGFYALGAPASRGAMWTNCWVATLWVTVLPDPPPGRGGHVHALSVSVSCAEAGEGLTSRPRSIGSPQSATWDLTDWWLASSQTLTEQASAAWPPSRPPRSSVPR